ncbi:MAG: cytochrome P450 [Actinobacteria bacterium]|nr:cytochrome P450 [Actinomycetota bacterium]
MARLEDYDLMTPETQQCPYPFYELTRAEAPVYRMPRHGFHLVTGFDVAREAVRKPDLFLSGVSPMALAEDGVPQEIVDIYVNEGWVPLASCSTSDPPVHTRVRGFLERLFTPSTVRTMRPMIDRVANDLIDAFEDRGSVELVSEFAHPMPMIIIAELLGVPTTDIERFKAWSDAIVEPFSLMVSREREIECARLVVEMQHFFAEMIEERHRDPRDDLITKAVQHRDADGRQFDMQELLTIVTIDLLASGNETTTAAIASGVKLLIEDPAPIAELRTDPRLYRNLAEEVIRLESPAQGMFRRVSADTTLGGVELHEGDLLSIRFGAANRDESQFPDPTRIDLHRRQPGKHLGLGMGRHHCIGAPLARQELVSAFTALLTRLDDLRLTPGTHEPSYVPSFFGRNLRELHVSFGRRDGI